MNFNLIIKYTVFVHVPFTEKEVAKRSGAKWWPSEKCWYYDVYKNQSDKWGFSYDDEAYEIVHTCGFKIKKYYDSDNQITKNSHVKEINNILVNGNIEYNKKSHEQHFKDKKDFEDFEMLERVKEECRQEKIIEKIKLNCL